jgi:ketosteroid isomerase-like protein
MTHLALRAALAIALITAAPALADEAPSPAPVAAAERAFAADGRVAGIRESFLRSVAPDGIVLRPGPVNAREFLTAQPADPADRPELFWWPTWVGISNGGDLGVSSGPVTIAGRHGGHYFTVWQRQADGRWKWVFDAGAGAIINPLPAPDATPAFVPPPVGRAASPEAAMAEVRRAEAALAATARTDQRTAHLAVVGEGARVLVARVPPADSRTAIEAALPGWPPTFEFDPPTAGGSAASADLVWVLGPARWTREGQAREGHYVHVWRHEAAGWRLLFAEIVPAGQ